MRCKQANYVVGRIQSPSDENGEAESAGAASDEGPVGEHEREALRRAIVANNLPGHHLLVRCLPPHARLARTAGEVRPALHEREESSARLGFPKMYSCLVSHGNAGRQIYGCGGQDTIQVHNAS